MRSSDSHERDLVKSAVNGSVEAWHQLIEQYTGLIYSLIRRYIVQHDEDDLKTIYVDVLETLHQGALARFDGQASLSTWIGVVTRSRCMDYLRRQYGRRQDPIWLDGLSTEDQEVYRLFYVEGHSFSRISDQDLGNGNRFSVETLVEALDRIDAHLDRSTRRRLAFELKARSVAAVTGRLLEYLAFARQEAEEARAAYHSDLRLLEQEARQLLGRVDKAMLALDTVERDVVRLRYFDGLTAQSVAAQMNLRSTRRVYTISDRALRKLRRILVTQEVFE